jgi:hypothetical protein
MTQLHNDVGQMAFSSIGFHAALVLNKLRNQKRIEDDRRTEEDGRAGQDEDGERAGRELTDQARLVIECKKRGSS